MRPAALFGAFLIACGGSSAGGPASDRPQQPLVPGELAEEDRFVPTYGKPELQQALITERGAEATGEGKVREIEALVAAGSTSAGTDRLRVALADLAVRRRFIAMLEACESQGRFCPPRLDDPPWTFDYAEDAAPPITAPLRFDDESWRTIAAELHGRACACRTLGCIESMEVVLNQLEKRPMPAVLGDEVSSLSLTRARECLSRLRGTKRVRIVTE